MVGIAERELSCSEEFDFTFKGSFREKVLAETRNFRKILIGELAVIYGD